MSLTTDINYPAGLPFPEREGYSINHVQPFVRTELSDGRAAQWRRFSNVPSIVDVSWIFHGDTIVAAFEAWFRDQLFDGAAWFNCPLRTPVGTKMYVCRFTQMYQGPFLVGKCAWSVSAQLEIFERPLLPEGSGLFPEFYAYADIIDIATNDKWPEAE